MNLPIPRGIAVGVLALAAVASVLTAQTPATRPAAPPQRPAAAPPANNPSTTPVTRPEDAPTRNPVDPHALPPGSRQVPTPPTVDPSGDPEDQPPPIKLDPEICDFGFVKPSETPTKTMKIINTSDKPVTILAVQPSCKCTTVNDLVGQEIPPGGSVNLDASMKAQSAPGPKKAEIKILFDGWARVVNVQLSMEVTLPIRVVPGYINAVKGQPQKGRIVVESLDKQPFKICSVGGRTPDLVGFDPAKDEPKNQYLMQWDATEFKQGEMPRFLLIETDRADCPIVDVLLRHEFTQPKPVLKILEYRLSVGRLDEDQSGEFTIEVNELPANEPLAGIATSMTGARVEFTGEAVTEGLKTTRKARITPPKGFTGIMYAPITVFTLRRQQDLTVFGLVAPKGSSGCLGPMEKYEGCSMKVKSSAAAVANPAAKPAVPVAPAAPTKSELPKTEAH